MTSFSRDKGLSEEKLFGEVNQSFISFLFHDDCAKIFHAGETGSAAERTRSTPGKIFDSGCSTTTKVDVTYL